MGSCPIVSYWKKLQSLYVSDRLYLEDCQHFQNLMSNLIGHPPELADEAASPLLGEAKADETLSIQRPLPPSEYMDTE